MVKEKDQVIAVFGLSQLGLESLTGQCGVKVWEEMGSMYSAKGSHLREGVKGVMGWSEGEEKPREIEQPACVSF